MEAPQTSVPFLIWGRPGHSTSPPLEDKHTTACQVDRRSRSPPCGAPQYTPLPPPAFVPLSLSRRLPGSTSSQLGRARMLKPTTPSPTQVRHRGGLCADRARRPLTTVGIPDHQSICGAWRTFVQPTTGHNLTSATPSGSTSS
ncbi:hypothetical protein C8Q78DRAFT_1011539 [Trametes maxima]|nr:hypothetical protein C8Q78DRAFT_1011539 [Trametes maxima]